MALRLLRLHGYPISPDVLNNFGEKDGKVFCFVGQTHPGLSDMFNMYRFSQVRFPGETIMKEAQAFAEGYLKSCLKQKHLHDKWSLKKAFHKVIPPLLQPCMKQNLLHVEWLRPNAIMLRTSSKIHESVEDLRALFQAVAGWDPISVNHLPERLKSAFWLMYSTFNEVATSATKAQATDMFPYLLDLRVRQVEAYMNHREEDDRKQVLTVLHEHLGNGKEEAGIGMRVFPAMFLLREHLPDNLLEKLDYRSKIHDRLSLFIKLLIDTTGNVVSSQF
ncbi:bifunctional abietadiene synthase, chloroplastic-like [Aristolochia californica]|uniref:bifunctional abietadiene synthase, chloroplastic-like n=1 Tax=Aristolochia californica TaxID=171875 RepID=UPI0035E1F19E